MYAINRSLQNIGAWKGVPEAVVTVWRARIQSEDVNAVLTERLASETLRLSPKSKDLGLGG